MHSNFITAPDYVENILVIGATLPEAEAIADVCRNNDQAYNVYFYNSSTEDVAWLNRVAFRVDTILLQENLLEFKMPNPVGFGPNCELKTPAEYFINKQ
jgi:hypothetical protein